MLPLVIDHPVVLALLNGRSMVETARVARSNYINLIKVCLHLLLRMEISDSILNILRLDGSCQHSTPGTSFSLSLV